MTTRNVPQPSLELFEQAFMLYPKYAFQGVMGNVAHNPSQSNLEVTLPTPMFKACHLLAHTPCQHQHWTGGLS